MAERTIELLTELRALGFSDEDFAIVNHRGEDGSIERRLNYAGKHEFQVPGRMLETEYRLEIVRAAYFGQLSRSPEKRPDFRSLAQAARDLIPL